VRPVVRHLRSQPLADQPPLPAPVGGKASIYEIHVMNPLHGPYFARHQGYRLDELVEIIEDVG